MSEFPEVKIKTFIWCDFHAKCGDKRNNNEGQKSSDNPSFEVGHFLKWLFNANHG